MTRAQAEEIAEIAATLGSVAALIRYDEMTAENREIEAETREAQQFERDAYGDPEADAAYDRYSSAEHEYNDRLSMGRNDAGEWLGFM